MDNMELIIYSKESEFCHQAKKNLAVFFSRLLQTQYFRLHPYLWCGTGCFVHKQNNRPDEMS